MGMSGVGGGAQSMNVQNSKTVEPSILEAAKKKLQAAEDNNFEGLKKIEPNNFEDSSEVSKQSASIGKNLKEASQELKEMLKNPNAFTDCFPSVPKGPKNQVEGGGTKTPLSKEQMQAKLQTMSQAAQNGATLTPMTAEEVSQMPKSPKGPQNQVEGGSTKTPLSEEQMQAKLQTMSQAAQNGATLTPMTAEEIAKMQSISKK